MQETGGRIMFRECPFCGSTHQSRYVEELEESVLACRATADRHKLGLLADYAGYETHPIPCEMDVLQRGTSDLHGQEQAA